MKRLVAVLASLVTLSLEPTGEDPPKEFRIFKAGANPTTKGTVIFDADAARAVMAAYTRHGVDVMIDLEHLSLDDSSRNFDPDARGWMRLEVRETKTGPELWAVNVTWTPDGEARLREKRQRYISPAFKVDRASGRVVSVVNVAITAMPATDKLTPLVAASARKAMIPPKLLELLGLPADADEKAVADAIAADPMKAMAAFAECMAAPPAPPAPTGATATDNRGAPSAAPSGVPSGAPAGTVKKVTTEYQARDEGTDSALAREVLQLRAEVNARDVREIIAANRDKCTAALEQWALKQSPAALRDFFASAPVVVAASHREPKKTPATEAELTKEELRMCRATGTDPKELLAHKVKLAARAAAEDE